MVLALQYSQVGEKEGGITMKAVSGMAGVGLTVGPVAVTRPIDIGK